MERNCPGEEDHHPSLVNFSERCTGERKLTHLSEPRADNGAPALTDRVDPAWRARMFMWRKVGPVAMVTLPSNKDDPGKRVTLPSNKGDPGKRVNLAVN